jgi:hypothetical protein
LPGDEADRGDRGERARESGPQERRAHSPC